jgi:hypothetical protein
MALLRNPNVERWIQPVEIIEKVRLEDIQGFGISCSRRGERADINPKPSVVEKDVVAVRLQETLSVWAQGTLQLVQGLPQ